MRGRPRGAGPARRSAEPGAATRLLSGARGAAPPVAVDVVIFAIAREVLHTLLVRIKEGPFAGRWAFPGGLVPAGESLDEAAARELFEKTGIRNVYLEQLYTFGDPGRDPKAHVVSVAYFALIPSPLRPPRPRPPA